MSIENRIKAAIIEELERQASVEGCNVSPYVGRLPDDGKIAIDGTVDIEMIVIAIMEAIAP